MAIGFCVLAAAFIDLKKQLAISNWQLAFVSPV
jgi:hypothetical protein